MISFKNVTKVYGGTVKAVDNLTLDLYPGEIYGFLGPNGAGKTTSIKMLTGILRQDSGEIMINGKNMLTDPLEAKKEFGYVPDNPDMFLRLKGIEFLNFMGDIYQVPGDVSALKDRKPCKALRHGKRFRRHHIRLFTRNEAEDRPYGCPGTRAQRMDTR